MRDKFQTFKQWSDRENVAGILCTLPFIVGFFAFLIVPMLISLYYSFCDYNILSPPVWIGLSNYKTILTDDPKFLKSIGVTFYYSFVSVPLKLIFALMIAMILYRPTKITPLYRAIYYLPSVIGSSVAVSILWRRVFSIDGVLNNLLGIFGLNKGFPWLGDTRTAIWVLILLTVWQFGSSMLIFLAALKQIPSTLYEASRVEGAGRWSQFCRITLPLLTPTIFFNLVMQTIFGLLAFTQCYIITQGRPLNSTLFYTVYMYQQSFEYYNAGYGAALAWIMLLIIGFVTLTLFATKKFWVFDGE